MIIEKNIAKYCVNVQETIGNALQKIIDTKGRVVFAVSELGVLEGLFTNGDFLRWVMSHQQVDLNLPLSHIINRNFIYATTSDSPEKIKSSSMSVFYTCPILDERRRLVAVARQRMKGEGVRIGDFVIDDQSPTFIIAEIGINLTGV
jgi:N-acetylneuraminate synthase